MLTEPVAEPYTFCVTPMPRRNHQKCFEHARIFSTFLREVGLDDFRFSMIQRNPLYRIHQGKTTIELEFEEGDHSDSCVIKVSSAGDECFPYVIAHSEISATGIYDLLFKAMGEKEKIRLS